MKDSPTTPTSCPTTSIPAAWEERGGTIIRKTSRLFTGGATGKRDRVEGDVGRCAISEDSGPRHLCALVTDPPAWEPLLRLLGLGLRRNELRIRIAQVFPAGALAGVVIESVLKKLKPGGTFLDNLGPGLGPNGHVVVAPGIRFALVDHALRLIFHLGFELGLFVHLVGQRPEGPVRPHILEPLVGSDGESVTAHLADDLARNVLRRALEFDDEVMFALRRVAFENFRDNDIVPFLGLRRDVGESYFHHTGRAF